MNITTHFLDSEDNYYDVSGTAAAPFKQVYANFSM